MGAKPLADAYEKLKELRRGSNLTAEGQSRIGHQLRAMYDDVDRQGVPDRFADLIRKLDIPSEVSQQPDSSADFIRALEIKTLADRVFGDEEKADAWLQRPNRSLSGQRPADLLRDELGT